MIDPLSLDNANRCDVSQYWCGRCSRRLFHAAWWGAGTEGICQLQCKAGHVATSGNTFVTVLVGGMRVGRGEAVTLAKSLSNGDPSLASEWTGIPTEQIAAEWLLAELGALFTRRA